MRQVVLDTETTGLEVEQGHRIIEIGCVELVNRRRTHRTFHHYVQPDREIEPGALEVHGISAEALAGKPRFAELAHEFLEFVAGAELVIHNADFDTAFLNNELKLCGRGGQPLQELCAVIDTLAMARRLHPGQRNSLDALCRRYSIDNSGREYHGALLDAQLLAEVYLAMSGGQATLSLDEATGLAALQAAPVRRVDRTGLRLVVIEPSARDLASHEAYLDLIDRHSAGKTLWRRLGPGGV